MKTFFLYLSLIFFNAHAGSAPVATVNGLPVSKQEVLREMQRYRAVVFSKYHSRRMDLLQDKAMEAMIAINVQEQLLKQNHCWPYTDYKNLLADREKVNRERQLMAQRKQAVYGPVIYTEIDFFDYQFTNAILNLKRRLRWTDSKYKAEIKKAELRAVTDINKKMLSAVAL